MLQHLDYRDLWPDDNAELKVFLRLAFEIVHAHNSMILYDALTIATGLAHYVFDGLI